MYSMRHTFGADQENVMINVYIEGVGHVTAKLLERYADGDVRVMYNGLTYICKED